MGTGVREISRVIADAMRLEDWIKAAETAPVAQTKRADKGNSPA